MEEQCAELRAPCDPCYHPPRTNARPYCPVALVNGDTCGETDSIPGDQPPISIDSAIVRDVALQIAGMRDMSQCLFDNESEAVHNPSLLRCPMPDRRWDLLFEYEQCSGILRNGVCHIV